MDSSTSSNSMINEQIDSLWFKFGKEKSQSPKQAISIANRTELYYPMRNVKCGRCLVLNYKEFSIDQPVRHGTEHDVAALEQTFKALGFDFEVKHNLSKRDTKDYLNLVSTLDHEKYDCFVLCILSHGDKDLFYCNDGSLYTDFIINMFTTNRCPSLTGKPKIFFIQACQGDLFDSGTLVTDSVNSPDSNSFLIPNYADFLIFYSTYPGFFAWRNAAYGSWFINDLCSTLKEHAHEHDLVTMLTITCQKVAFNRQSNVPNDKERHMKKQVPYLTSTLTRLIRFNYLNSREIPIDAEAKKRSKALKLVTTNRIC